MVDEKANCYQNMIHSLFFLLLLFVCIMTFLVSVCGEFPAFCLLAVCASCSNPCEAYCKSKDLLCDCTNYFCIFLPLFVVSVFYRFPKSLWMPSESWGIFTGIRMYSATLISVEKWKNMLMTNIKYCWELNERIIDQNWIVAGWVCYTIRTNLKQAQSCLFILNVQKITRITEPQNFRGQLLHAESDVQTKGATKHYYTPW